jgi:hypothetical protein
MTLDQHGLYWRSIAAQERLAGNERLARDYERMAAVAESLSLLLLEAEVAADSLAGRGSVS